MSDDFKSDLGASEVSHDASEKAPRRRKKTKGGFWLSLVLLVVLAVLVIVVLDRVVGVNIFTSEQKRQEEKVQDFLTETGAWHAVFLTNGQVYFGQLSDADAQFATLRDVYYLQLQQVQQPQQAAPTSPAEGGSKAGSQVISAPQPQPPRLTLIKFGTEIHGPKDFMKINRDHILFWEELNSDSTVVKAIQKYKEGQNN